MTAPARRDAAAGFNLVPPHIASHLRRAADVRRHWMARALCTVLDQVVRVPLRASLAEGFYLPVRAALGARGTLPVAWYGQQDAWWIAYHDALRHLGLARYRCADSRELAQWVTLAESCGWWWPGEDTCVVVDRPVAVRTRPVPGAEHEELRLDRGNARAVEHRDGWHIGA